MTIKVSSYALNHVAISVPDLVGAMNWYKEVLGFHRLKSIATFARSERPNATIFQIYPAELNKVSVVAMSAGNGLGIELFQFHDPAITADTKASFASDYKRGGFFHIAVTASDVEGLCQKVIATGGKRLGATVPAYEYESAYVEEPWGNVIELLSGSFERVMANRG